MRNSKRFPYVKKINNLGQENFVPYVQITLNYGNVSVKSMGLLNTGATIFDVCFYGSQLAFEISQKH